MNRQPTLEGPTLLLRPLREQDWDALCAVAADPLVWEQHPMHDRWREPVFRAYFDEALASGGALAVTERQSSAVIGCSQLRPTPLDPEAVEIGWTFLARAHWGKGANAEMKRLMLAHALTSLPRVLFRIGETNHRSRKAMEKIGGRLTDLREETEHEGRRVVHVVYRIARENFAAGPLSRRPET